MEHAVIQQRVSCVFGDDHLITVEVGTDNTLGVVTTTCTGEAKEETEGLILLGTDPYKTCLGYMKAFLKHVNNENPSYNQTFDKEYKGTLLHLIGGTLNDKVRGKAEARRALVKEQEAIEAAKATSNLVCDMFKEHAYKALGPAADGIIFIKNPDNTYKACVAGRTSRYDYSTRKSVPLDPPAVADRVKGEWVIRPGALEPESAAFMTLDYGGRCVHCQAKGNRNHNTSVKHEKTLVKNVLIALQAASAEGVRLTKTVVDAEGNTPTFTYRANMKIEKLIGVRFARQEA